MRKISYCVSLLLIFLACLSTGAQQAPRYGPFVPTAEWNEIMFEIGRVETRAQGVAKMLQLAEREKGTTMGAHALATARAYTADSATATQILQKLLRDYPNSSFSLEAEIAQLNGVQHSTWDSWQAAHDRFLKDHGAPTLTEVLRNRKKAVRQARALHPDIQAPLMQIYYSYACWLRKSERYRDCLTVSSFGDDAGFQRCHIGFPTMASLAIDYLNGGPQISTTIDIDPEVVVRSPRAAHRVGPRPHIRFDTRSGDYRHAQPMDPQVQLDGQDITSLFEVQTKRDTKHRTGSGIYDTVSRYSFRPATPLSPGRHSLTVTVQSNHYGAVPGAPGRTVKTWSFEVQPHCDEGPDEDDVGEDD